MNAIYLGLTLGFILSVVALVLRYQVKIESTPAAAERAKQEGLAKQLRAVNGTLSGVAQRDALNAIARFHGLDEDALQAVKEVYRES